MSETEVLRILLADDHPIVRMGIVALINNQMDMKVIVQASNGREAVDLFRSHRPDIVLMDWRMPEMNGLDALEIILQESSAARVIMLSTYDAQENIYRAFQAGARAFLLKETTGEQLLETIRLVGRGQLYFPPDIAAKLADRLHQPELTGREMEVLRLLVAGKSNQEIAGILFITEGTVKSHVNNILTKLRVSDRTQAVTAALKRGLMQLA